MLSWFKRGLKTKRNNEVKKGVTFSNKTHVRNQYESINPETGEHQVNLNEYNTNASKNDEMPGYYMTHPKFVPHSKSSLVRASQINNSGWSRAISSVGPNVHANLQAASRNKMYMKNRYGNAWINAEAKLEDAYNVRDDVVSKAVATYNKDMEELEADFLEKSGVEAPTIMEKDIDAELEKFIGKYTNYELATLKYKLEAKARVKLMQVPVDIRLDFEEKVGALRKRLEKVGANADQAVMTAMNMIPSGKPYNKKVKRTLKNRLATAHVIASMAPVAAAAAKVTNSKKKKSFF